MVIQGKSEPGRFILLSPKTLDEIRSMNYEKFIIKFSKSRCPPCKQFQSWLESGEHTPHKQVPIISISLDNPDQLDVANYFRELYTFNCVPYVVFTNKQFKIISEQSGFQPDIFVNNINKCL